jgi:predicted dehydrogenase
MDSIKQAAQLTGSTLRSAARIATGTWNTGVDTIIQRYADALRRGEEPPVTVEEGLEVTRTLEEMALMIDEAEKNRVLEV